MGVSLAGADEEEGQETAVDRWGLMWDPEEGPVWGNIGDTEGRKQEDVWTQLLREGVSGITTDRDGENSCYFSHDAPVCPHKKQMTKSFESQPFFSWFIHTHTIYLSFSFFF